MHGSILITQKRHSISSLTQIHGGFTEAAARSATAPKWCSQKLFLGMFTAATFPLLKNNAHATVFIIAIIRIISSEN